MTSKKDANGKKDRGLSNGEKRIQEIFEWKKDKAGVISCSYKQYFIPRIF
jgi:hypothetical protein